MKTLLTRYSALALMVASLGLASCTEEEGPINPGTNDIDSLAATALNSTTIAIRWANGTASDEVVVTPAPTIAPVVGSEMATIGGLTLGTTYTIKVTNDDGESSTLTWAPARRWPLESGGGLTKTRIYSTGAPGADKPSGLVIGPGDIHAVSTEGPEATDIDMVLAFDADPNIPVYLQSPDVEGSGIPAADANKTNFGEKYMYVAGGLNNDFYLTSIEGMIPTASRVNSVPVTRHTSSQDEFGLSLIALFLTEDNHFGRVEIVPQPGGLLFGTETVGGNTYEFVDVAVSYQTITGEGYVSRPRARRNELAPRILGNSYIKKN